MCWRAGTDSLPRMTRSAAPGLLIAFAVLVAGLLLAFTVGRYPIGLADLFNVVAAKLTGRAADVPSAVESVIWQVRGPRVLAAALVGAALAVAGTAFQGLFRNPLVSPDHPRRVVGRGARRGARHLFLARRVRDPGVRLRRRARRGRGGLSDRLGGARARPDPGAGADRRGDRLAARRRRRPREVSRRSLQPASGHDVLAARQPRRHQRRRSRAAVRPGRARHLGAAGAALAHERDVAAGRGGACARASDRPAAHRHRRRGDAGDLGERRDRRHHRLGRSRGAASSRARWSGPISRGSFPPRRCSAAAFCW